MRRITNSYSEGKHRVIRILFVCTGNICRSPTAEGVFRHLARKAGMEDGFYIDSAGTNTCHAGEAPDRRAVKVAQDNGVSLDGIRARALRDSDFQDFDRIFAMDGGHLFEMNERAPHIRKAQIEMFLAALDDEDRLEVPDPWYGGDADFKHAYALIHAGAEALLSRLCQERKP